MTFGQEPDAHRICNLCNREQTLDQFSKYTNQTKRGPRQHYMRRCRECQRQKVQEYRNGDPEKYNAGSTQRNQDKKKRAIEYMGGKCVDCAGVFPSYVYDFHHLDPREKDITPALALQRKWEHAIKELDKCVLLCANCHRGRHYDTGISKK